jgi:hypothetical protein
MECYVLLMAQGYAWLIGTRESQGLKKFRRFITICASAEPSFNFQRET